MHAEQRVKSALEREFKQPFNEERLLAGKKLDGTAAYKKFDAVSSNGKIVAMVKDYSAGNEQGNQTRHARVMHDLYYLSLVSADKKLMFLSKQYYEWFVEQNDAAIAPGIELRVLPA